MAVTLSLKVQNTCCHTAHDLVQGKSVCRSLVHRNTRTCYRLGDVNVWQMWRLTGRFRQAMTTP